MARVSRWKRWKGLTRLAHLSVFVVEPMSPVFNSEPRLIISLQQFSWKDLIKSTKVTYKTDGAFSPCEESFGPGTPNDCWIFNRASWLMSTLFVSGLFKGSFTAVAEICSSAASFIISFHFSFFFFFLFFSFPFPPFYFQFPYLILYEDRNFLKNNHKKGFTTSFYEPDDPLHLKSDVWRCYRFPRSSPRAWFTRHLCLAVKRRLKNKTKKVIIFVLLFRFSCLWHFDTILMADAVFEVSHGRLN